MTDMEAKVARAIAEICNEKGQELASKYAAQASTIPWQAFEREAKAVIEAMPWDELEEEQPEKWSFDTLMLAADRLLASRYPETVFTGVSGDCGARLVAALRDCRKALEGNDADKS